MEQKSKKGAKTALRSVPSKITLYSESPISQQYSIPNYSIFDKTKVFEVGFVRNIKLKLRS